MAYIGDHLDDELPLDKLAEIACFSPYHFHRIYRWIAGETAGETIRRLRLHRAAVELTKRPGRSARSRPPPATARWRPSPVPSPPTMAPAGPVPCRQGEPAASPPCGDDTMHDVSIKTFDGAHLAALEHRGDYSEIGRRFEELTAWASAHDLFRQPRRWFAIYYDDPAAVPVEALRSDACVEVPPGYSLGRVWSSARSRRAGSPRWSMWALRGARPRLPGALRRLAPPQRRGSRRPPGFRGVPEQSPRGPPVRVAHGGVPAAQGLSASRKPRPNRIQPRRSMTC
jgi:AraC family transcriptional regulator